MRLEEIRKNILPDFHGIKFYPKNIKKTFVLSSVSRTKNQRKDKHLKTEFCNLKILFSL